MNSKITGKEYPLREIFGNQFSYYIPEYQRPYSWTTDETETLFDDLVDFYQTEQIDNYFLGSIVLIKEDDNPRAEVIDGQQRLVTLTILFSAIHSLLREEDQKKCYEYIYDYGNRIEGRNPSPRIHLRAKDQPFFYKYIQSKRDITELVTLDMASIQLESQKHIKENFITLIGKIYYVFEKNKDALFNFLQFLMTKCYLIAVYTQNYRAAFRIFSVINNRGLDLMATDILKSEIIGQIPEEEQKNYADKWEEMEVRATRSGFNEIIGHINMIYVKTRTKQNMLELFQKNVLEKYKPKELIDNIMEPCTEAYITLSNKNYVAVKNSEEVNQYLFWLNKIGGSDWMPPAIKFTSEHKNEPDYMLWFMKKLERLAAFLHITGKDINNRVKKYAELLKEMDEFPDHNINAPLLSMELSEAEKKDFIDTLNGEIYNMTAVRRNYVILRLNDLVGDGAARFDFEPSTLTIEHVLPQTVRAKSEWAKLWPRPSVRETWINRIANLVPLTRKKNSAAQNYDFDKKKEVYFKGKNGTTTYPLTTQVLAEKTWTLDVVKARQEMLMGKFKECWDLQYVSGRDMEDMLEDGTPLFHILKRGANATGFPTEDGFVVRAGSRISDTITESFKEKYVNAYKKREELCIDSKIIINGVFREDYKFEKISLAAAVVLGRNASGQREWLDCTGIPYFERMGKNDNMEEYIEEEQIETD